MRQCHNQLGEDMAEYFLALNDNCVALDPGLVDKKTGDFVNDAIATVSIKDGVTFLIEDQAMDYVSGSDGVYRTIVFAAAAWPAEVTVEINATAGDGSIYESNGKVFVQPRAFQGQFSN